MASSERRRLPFSARDLTAKRTQIQREARTQTAYHPNYDHIKIKRARHQSSHDFADFMRDARSQIATLASKPQGASLLNQIEHNARTRAADNRALAPDSWRRKPSLDLHVYDSVAMGDGGGVQRPVGPRGSEHSPTRGSASDILIRRVGANFGRDRPYMPTFVSTGHEMVHALRAQKGIQSRSRMEEELETVGGIFRTPSPQGVTENSIRREHGLPKRNRY